MNRDQAAAPSRVPAFDFPHDFIKLYWLSGLFGEGFELWTGRRDRGAGGLGEASYTLYLLYPLKEEEEEPAHLVLRRREGGYVFAIDWFPGEEFPLTRFVSEDGRESLLTGEAERETVFIRLS
ncbi:MAG: hypothetical protein K6T55_05040 [Syntrophobacterales bacterium]|jgi:hypothetical protein|nr:hypothetical protein [Syntrophobacterales bacterium]